MSLPILLGEKFNRAFQSALTIHATDVRKGTGAPYVCHLLQVAGLVLEFGGTEEEAIGGLLHDAAEDSGGERMLAWISQEFGPVVAGIVRENSDSLTESKDKKAPWKDRKDAYIAAMSHKSESALLVSICDKIHNARALLSDQRALGDAHWSRFNCTKEQSLWYYRSLVDQFRTRYNEFPRLQRAVAEVDSVVTDLEQAG